MLDARHKCRKPFKGLRIGDIIWNDIFHSGVIVQFPTNGKVIVMFEGRELPKEVSAESCSVIVTVEERNTILRRTVKN